jgi:hypothetical protein
MIEIEQDKIDISKCDCCGGKVTNLTRFVYQDGDAFAIYYVSFTEGHEDKVAYALIGIGEWGEDSTPDQRKAYSLKLWEGTSDWQVTVTDRDESPWKDVKFLGRILNRDEALKDPMIKDVFHISDHIRGEDRAVVEDFNSKRNV